MTTSQVNNNSFSLEKNEAVPEFRQQRVSFYVRITDRLSSDVNDCFLKYFSHALFWYLALIPCKVVDGVVYLFDSISDYWKGKFVQLIIPEINDRAIRDDEVILIQKDTIQKTKEPPSEKAIDLPLIEEAVKHEVTIKDRYLKEFEAKRQREQEDSKNHWKLRVKERNFQAKYLSKSEDN